MTKNIEMIHVDSSLLKWTVETLTSASNPPADAEEFIQALASLADGNCSSLMLEQGELYLAQSDSKTICCGALSINVTSRKVLRNQEEILLTPKEFDILYFLAKNRGEVFTKEQIYQAVWDSEYLLDDNNIMAFIRKLRKKIEPNPDAPQYILTIWGIGYKFNDAI